MTASWQDSPDLSAPAPSGLPRPRQVLAKPQLFIPCSSAGRRTKPRCSLHLLLIVVFLLIPEGANNNTAGAAPRPKTVSFRPFFLWQVPDGFLASPMSADGVQQQHRQGGVME